MNTVFRWLMSAAIFCVIAYTIYALTKFTLVLDKEVTNPIPTKVALQRKFAKEHAGWKNLHFDLVDPEEAPPEIKSLVIAGYQIMLHTHEALPNNVNNLLNCTNCHFAGGNTIGGSDGGISLVGVAAKYPTLNKRLGAVEDLAQRINSCFTKSMNGKPLALDSKEMLALLTYLHWISYDYPTYSVAPWLGLKPLFSKHTPDANRGKELYRVHCATCHGNEGQGANLSKKHPGLSFPPIWGPKSFNKRAGMNELQNLSSFIYFNMPYEEPHLNAEDALDVAAFIIAQPRSP